MIRKITLEDYNAIWKLHLESFTNSWSESVLIYEMYYNPDCVYFVVTKDDNIIGVFGLRYDIDSVLITMLCVDKLYQRQGVATKMLEYILENNINKIKLEVAIDNDAAINLYKKFGFKVIKLLKDYYPDSDAYSMEVKNDNYGNRN